MSEVLRLILKALKSQWLEICRAKRVLFNALMVAPQSRVLKLIAYGLVTAKQGGICMYDLIIDEVFVGSYDSWDAVVRELIGFEPMIKPANVRIDYHE